MVVLLVKSLLSMCVISPQTGYDAASPRICIPMSLQYKPETARRYLKNADPIMAQLIKRVGPFKMETEFELSPFEALLRAIVHQQLSMKAAAAIHGRVTALFGKEIKPRALLNIDPEMLRTAGLSKAKVLAVKDLAARRLDGTVPELDVLQADTNENIIERLCAVRGVGRWTVEMMLIFRLGRPDVLPLNDLGVRKGYHFAYGTDDLPTPVELTDAGLVWAPYRSVASWYLWRASELDWS